MTGHLWHLADRFFTSAPAWVASAAVATVALALIAALVNDNVAHRLGHLLGRRPFRPLKRRRR